MKMTLRRVLTGVFLGQGFPVGRLQQGFLLDARTEIICRRRSRLLLRPAVGVSVHKGELCTHI